MVNALFLAALAWLSGQQAAAQPPVMPRCSLVAPNGDAIGFWAPMWNSSGNLLGLIRGRDAVWPRRTLVGRQLRSDPQSFAFGGDDGLVVRLGEDRGGARRISIHRREGDRAGLPLAYGFCLEEAGPMVHSGYDSAIDPSEIGDAIPAFDPEAWPAEGCALLLGDGRRLLLSYRLVGQRVELANEVLWPDGPVRTELRRGRPERGVGVAAFSRRGGPSGTEQFFVAADQGRAVKLLSFDDVGGASAQGQNGFGICGYNDIVRRAARGA